MLCVGLDPHWEQVSACLPKSRRPVFEFCRAVVDATAHLACVFKPQIACFAAARAEQDLEALIAHIHAAHPEVPVLLDAKRGDVGATAERYAEEAFVRYNADGVTVNPLLGWESIEPYRRHGGRGVALLCRTSNPDSAWLQDHPPDDPLYLRIARAAQERDADDLLLVLGATYPAALAAARGVAGDVPFLVPGVGAQGGDLGEALAAGRDAAGRGLVVNASRSVIFAEVGPGFAGAARASAEALHRALRLPAAPQSA